MTRKLISLAISMLLLISCFAMPIGVSATTEETGAFSFSQDFTDVNLSEATTDLAAVSEAIGLTVTTEKGQAKTAYSFQTTDGKLSVALNDTTARRIRIDYEFPHSIKTGVLEAEMTFKLSEGKVAWNLLQMVNGDTVTNTSAVSGSSGLQVPTNHSGAAASTKAISYHYSVDSAYKFHVVYSRPTEDDDWFERRYLVDASGHEQLIHHHVYPKETFDEFSTFRFTDPYISATGNSCVIDDLSVSYKTADTLNTQMSYSQDFSNVALSGVTSYAAFEEATGLKISENSYNSASGYISQGDYTFTNDNGKLKLEHDGIDRVQQARFHMHYDLVKPVYTGKITSELSLKETTSVYPFIHLFGIYNKNDETAFLGVSRGVSAANRWGDTVSTFSTAQNVPVLGSDGYFHLQATISRLSEDDNWDAILYDVSSPDQPKIVFSRVFSKDTFPYIQSVNLAGWQYNSGLNVVKTDYLDNFAVEYTSADELKENYTQDFTAVADGTYDTDAAVSAATGLNIIYEGRTVTAETAGNLTLNIAPSGGGGRVRIFHDLTAPITKGYLEASMTLKYGAFGGRVDFFTALDSTIAAANATTGSIGYNGSWMDSAGAEGTKIANPKAVDGAYKLRAVYTRTSTASDWLLNIYDDAYAKPVLVYTKTIAAADLSKISRLQLFTNYATSNQVVTFDDISIKSSYDLDLRTHYSQNFNELDDVTLTATDALTSYSATGGFPVEIGDNGTRAYNTAGISGGKFVVGYQSDYADSNAVIKSYVHLPIPVYEGVVSASMKLKPISITSGGTIHLFAFLNNDGQSVGTVQTDTADIYQLKTYDSPAVTKQPILNEDTGMFHLRAVISRSDSESDWTLHFIDESGLAPAILYTQTIAAADLTKIDNFRFFQSYAKALEFEVDDAEYTVSPYYKDVIRVNADFNSLEDGALTAEANQSFYDKTGLSIEKESTYNMGTVTVADGALAFDNYRETGMKITNVVYNLPVDVSEGTITASYKVSSMTAEDANQYIRFFTMEDATGLHSGIPVQYAGLTNGWQKGADVTVEGETETVTYATGKLANSPQADEAGNYLLRAVISRLSAEDAWEMSIYDDSQETPVLVATRTVDFGNIRKLTLINFCTGSAGTNPHLTLDDVAVTYAGLNDPADSLVEDDGEADDGGAEDEVIEESTIEIDNSLIWFTTENSDIVETVDDLAGLTDVIAVITAYNTESNGQKFTAIIAAYDEDGRLLSVNDEIITPSTEEAEYEIALEWTGEAANIKIFFVNKITNVRPISEVYDMSLIGGDSSTGFPDSI